MSNKLVVAIAALALFTLLITFALPSAITATQTNRTTVLVVQESESLELTPGLEITAVETNNNDATVSFRDVETNVHSNITLNQGETGNVTLNDEFFNVTVEETTPSEVRVAVEHARTYGWAPGTKLFVEQLDAILVVVAFAMLLFAIGMVISS